MFYSAEYVDEWQEQKFERTIDDIIWAHTISSLTTQGLVSSAKEKLTISTRMCSHLGKNIIESMCTMRKCVCFVKKSCWQTRIITLSLVFQPATPLFVVRIYLDGTLRFTTHMGFPMQTQSYCAYYLSNGRNTNGDPPKIRWRQSVLYLIQRKWSV